MCSGRAAPPAACSAGLGRAPEALKLLSIAEDIVSLDLLARLAWDAADWVTARDAYRRVDALGAFSDDALPKERQSDVLRWAMTASMLKNWPEVADIEARFLARLEDPVMAKALEALATPGLSNGAALAQARDAIAGAEKLADAVKAYSEARNG